MDENKNTENGFEASAPTGVFPDPTAAINTEAQTENTAPQGVFPEQPAQDFAAQSNTAPQQNMAAFGTEIPQQDYTNVTTYPVNDAAVKKSKAPIFIVIGAVFLAAVAAVILFMLFGSNQSYEKAERAFVNDVLSAFDQAMDTDGGSVGEMTITPTNALAELVGYDSLNPTTIKTEFAKIGTDASGNIQILNGTKTIISVKQWISDGRMALLIPDVSSLYITIDNASEAADDVDYETVKKAIDMFLDKYFLIVKDLKPEKGVSVTAGGITQKCDVYTIEVDQLFESKIKLAILETLQQYPEIADILNRYSDAEIDREEIAEEIEKCRTDITSYKENGCKKIGTLIAYVHDGKIAGREYTSDDGISSFKYIVLQSGSSYAAELSSSESSGQSVKVTNAGTTGESGSAGTIIAESSSTDIDKFTCTIDYTDFKLDDNHVSGKVTVSSPTAALNIDGVFSYDGTTDSAEFDVFVGGTNYGKISLSSKKTDSTPEKAPELTAENSCNTGDEDDPNGGEFTKDLFEFIGDIEAKFADDNGKYEVIYGTLRNFIGISGGFDGDDDYGFDDDDDDDYGYDDSDEDDDWDSDDNGSLSAEDRESIENYISMLEQYLKSDGTFDIDQYFKDMEVAAEMEGLEEFYAEYFLMTINTYRDVLDGKITLDEAEYIIESYFGGDYDDDYDNDYDYDDDDDDDDGFDNGSYSYGDYISADDISVTIGGVSYNGAIPFSAYEKAFPSIAADKYESDNGGYSKYYSNDDYTISLSGYYYGDNPPAVKDSGIYSIYCYSGCDADLAPVINGITLGSKEEELLKALPNPSYSSVDDYSSYYGYNTDDYRLSISFSAIDGYIVSIGYSYSE